VEVPISRPRDLSMEFGVEFLKTKKDIQTFVSQETAALVDDAISQ